MERLDELLKKPFVIFLGFLKMIRLLVILFKPVFFLIIGVDIVTHPLPSPPPPCALRLVETL